MRDGNIFLNLGVIILNSILRSTNPDSEYTFPWSCHTKCWIYKKYILGPDFGRDKRVPVTMAWLLLRLRMEDRPPDGRCLRIYWISGRGQPTGGGPPASVLGEVLTTRRHNNLTTLRNGHKSLGFVSSRGGVGEGAWNGSIWLRTGASDRLLWMR